MAKLVRVRRPALPTVDDHAAAGDAASAATAAAQIKADRAKIMLGVSFVMGVAASCAFGLFFLQAIGRPTPATPWTRS
jgi:hypothetical protein